MPIPGASRSRGAASSQGLLETTCRQALMSPSPPMCPASVPRLKPRPNPLKEKLKAVALVESGSVWASFGPGLKIISFSRSSATRLFVAHDSTAWPDPPQAPPVCKSCRASAVNKTRTRSGRCEQCESRWRASRELCSAFACRNPDSPTYSM